MRELREAGTDDLSQYSGVVENNLIFYVARPAIPAPLGKIDTLSKAFVLTKPIFMQQIKEKLEIPCVVCRNSAIHRNSWGAVLNADIVIEGLEDHTAVDVIRKHRRRIVRSARRHARRRSRLTGAVFLPLGYAYVAVFRRDYRRRRLSGFGLDSDLVCTVQLQKLRRIKSPDIIGSTVETVGKWRIAWNRAWLETSGKHVR